MKRVIYHISYATNKRATQILPDAEALALAESSNEWFKGPKEAREAAEEQLQAKIEAEQAKLEAAQAKAAKPKRKTSAKKRTRKQG